MKRGLIAGIVLILVMLLAGCAPGPNTLTDIPDQEGEIAGFWLGLWQGIIAPVTFIISLFGGWYNFGFILGVMIIFGGSGGGASRRRRRYD